MGTLAEHYVPLSKSTRISENLLRRLQEYQHLLFAILMKCAMWNMHCIMQTRSPDGKLPVVLGSRKTADQRIFDAGYTEVLSEDQIIIQSKLWTKEHGYISRKLFGEWMLVLLLP
jgi:hypothetical protein